MTGRVAALAVLLVMAVTCQIEPAPQPREIVIGSDLPSFGPATPGSQQISQGIRLAISQHPLVGSFRLGYEPLDDGTGVLLAPVRGVQNVRRMVADGQVLGAVGPFNSAGALEMIPVANLASFPMVSESVTNWCLTLQSPLCNPQPSALRVAGPNNFFRIVAPDPIEGRAVARYMATTLKVHHAAAFGLSGNFDDVTLKNFEEEFAKDGGEVAFSMNLPSNTDNFGPFLKAARSAGADAIFAATENDVCRARAQMNGIFPQGAYFVGMDNLQEGGTCIKSAGDNAEGMLATVSVLEMEYDPSAGKVAAAYRRAYPKSSPIDPYVFAAYDCTLILIDAITKAVEADGGSFPIRAQVVDAIAHTPLRGAVGTYRFDANGDALSPLMALYQVKGGKWVYVGQIDAGAHAVPPS